MRKMISVLLTTVLTFNFMFALDGGKKIEKIKSARAIEKQLERSSDPNIQELKTTPSRTESKSRVPAIEAVVAPYKTKQSRPFSDQDLQRMLDAKIEKLKSEGNYKPLTDHPRVNPTITPTINNQRTGRLVIAGVMDLTVPSGGNTGKALIFRATQDNTTLENYFYGIQWNSNTRDPRSVDADGVPVHPRYAFPEGIVLDKGETIWLVRSADAMNAYFEMDLSTVATVVEVSTGVTGNGDDRYYLLKKYDAPDAFPGDDSSIEDVYGVIYEGNVSTTPNPDGVDHVYYTDGGGNFEPYWDENADGDRDNSEPYVDTNGDGSWNGPDGSGSDWEYLDSWAFRDCNVNWAPNGPFNIGQWEVAPANHSDNTTTTSGSEFQFPALGCPEVYTENFMTPFFPQGFLTASMNTANDVTVSQDQFVTGPNSVRFSSFNSAGYGGDYTQYLMTPKLSVGMATGQEFTFKYLSYAFGSEVFSVGVSTTDTDVASFTFGEEILDANGTSWTDFTMMLDEYAGQDVYLAIKYSSNYAYYLYVDDFRMPSVWVDPNPSIVINPGAFSNGLSVLSSSVQSIPAFGIANIGGGDLVGTVAVAAGGSGYLTETASFGEDPNWPGSGWSFTVSPQGNMNVWVDADGAVVGNYTDTFIVTHNGASSPTTVDVAWSVYAPLTTFTEDFDGVWGVYNTSPFAAPAPAPGWTVINADNDNNTWSQANTYISGALNGFGAHGMGNNNDVLSTPLLISSGADRLIWSDVVESAAYMNSYRVTVTQYADDYSLSTFEVPFVDSNTGNLISLPGMAYDTLGTYDCINTALEEHVLDLSSVPAGAKFRVSFYQNFSAATFYGFAIDDVTFEPLPSAAVLSVSETALSFPATVVTETRVASFAVGNSGTGDISGTIAYPAGFTGPVAFTGATVIDVAYAPTTYGIHTGDVVITSNGGNATLSVSGNAGASVATWDDDVDGDGLADWPVGWEVINNDGGYKEFEFSDGGHTGDGQASVGYEYPNDDWLVSPKLEVVVDDMFTFYAGSESGLYLEDMKVMLSTTGGNTVTDFDVTLGEYTALASGYTLFSYDLSAYAASQIRVAVVCISNDAFFFNVDDIATSAVYQSAGPVIYDYATALDFGTTLVGDSESQMWDYSNTGGADLNVTSVTIDQPSFTVNSNSLPVVTAAGSIGGFEVMYTPTMDGPETATMTVVSDGGPDVVVSLSGAGLDAIYYEDFNTPFSMIAGDWQVAPIAGALRVGPSPGSGEWWQSSIEDVTTRACYFDDVYKFHADGSFDNDLGTETWLEAWQGVNGDQCGAPIAPHDNSSDAMWSYDNESGSLTISGVGAYLGIPKAYNGGELGASTDEVPAQRVYDVSMGEDGMMTVVIGVDGGYWTYILQDVDGPASPPWTFASDGNDLGEDWNIIEYGEGSGNFFPYHGYAGSAAGEDIDSLISPMMDLASIPEYYYELGFEEYQQFGSYATLSGLSITTDGGATWTPVWESDYANHTFDPVTVDLSGYDGQAVHFAFVYVGTFGQNFGFDNVTLKSKLAPVVPVAYAEIDAFEATAVGETNSAMLEVWNVGAGDLSGTIVYPAGFDGPTELPVIAAGSSDMFTVNYTPTASGLASGSITVNGAASGAASISVPVSANAGIEVQTMEDNSMGNNGWEYYDFFGQEFVSGGTSFSGGWLWVGGENAGHSGNNYMRVGTAGFAWGGSDDWMVSPRLVVNAGDKLSYFASSLEAPVDSVRAWVSVEEPVLNADGTGFENFASFVELGTETEAPLTPSWVGVEHDLSAYAGDEVYVMIHVNSTGYYLLVDDVAHPEVWINPVAELDIPSSLTFGDTDPDGSEGWVFFENAGLTDLMIEDVKFNLNRDFYVEEEPDFPITLAYGEQDSLFIVFEPEEYGLMTDTLVYYYGDAILGQSVFTGTASNGAPTTFMLLSPADNDTYVLTPENLMDGSVLSIGWTASSDPDGDQVEYEMGLAPEGFDFSNVEEDDDLSDLIIFPGQMGENLEFDGGMTGWNVYPENTNYEIVTETMSEYGYDYEWSYLEISGFGGVDGTTPNAENNIYQEFVGLPVGTQLNVNANMGHNIDTPLADGASVKLFAKYFGPNYSFIDMDVSEDLDSSFPTDDWEEFGFDGEVPEGATIVQIGVMFHQVAGNEAGVANVGFFDISTPLYQTAYAIPFATVGGLMIPDSVTSLTRDWTIVALDEWDVTFAENGPHTVTFTLDPNVLSNDGNKIGLPKEFALHNNYPNPFNPVTNITYDIPEVADVKVEIYNVMGQKVRTLASHQHQPGRYRIQWAATNDYGQPVSSGMYIYKIQAGNFSAVKKLVLMK